MAGSCLAGDAHSNGRLILRRSRMQAGKRGQSPFPQVSSAEAEKGSDPFSPFPRIKVRLLICLLAAVSATPLPAFAGDPCPPAGYSEGQLLELALGGFVTEDAAQRNALALGLMACLSEPNPAIRDGVAFEGTSTWLRGKSLAPETIQALYANLLVQIVSTADANGFQQPFAALVLAEVARTDRIDNTFTPAMRNELVGVAANYLPSVRDYRGFSETEGWRHGVAHGSDLVLQLVLNSNIDAAQIELLMNALATQIAPKGDVFYIYGEPGRLARAVFYAWARATVAPAFWQTWFDRIENPAPMWKRGQSPFPISQPGVSSAKGEKGSDPFSTSQAGLARRHNTMAFLLALHLNATVAGKQAEPLDALVLQALSQVQGD